MKRKSSQSGMALILVILVLSALVVIGTPFLLSMKLQERVTLFQERLQRVIQHSGLNRSSFATSIRVDRSTLSQLLSTENVRLPRADTVLSIAEVYQVSIDWLLGITQEGAMGANIVHEALEVDDSSPSIFE